MSYTVGLDWMGSRRCAGQLRARGVLWGIGKLDPVHRSRLLLAQARTDSLMRVGGLTTQASPEPADASGPCSGRPDARAQASPVVVRESSQAWSLGRRRLFAALEGSTLGSLLLPMMGLGAATSYATGGVGLAAAAAERLGSYQRARTFGKHVSNEATGGRSTNGPVRRRRKATSAWLDPLD